LEFKRKEELTMKRFFLILLVVAVIGTLSFGGCTEPAQQEEEEEEPEVLKIGSVFNLANPMYPEQKKWLDLFAKLVMSRGVGMIMV